MKVLVELEVDIPWIQKAPNSFGTLNSTLDGVKRDLPVRMSQAQIRKIQIEGGGSEVIVPRGDVVSTVKKMLGKEEEPHVEGQPDSLVRRIEQALLARHPVTLRRDQARNYAELAAFVANGGQ